GSDDGSKFDPKPTEGVFGEAGFDPDSDTTSADLYKKDPLPAWCGPAGGQNLPDISGTEECPSDKNKPGCACDKLGDKQPCWEGLRKHRNLGICHDGESECVRKNETLNVWGPCVGQQLPKRDARGREACSCFSIGEWKISNTAPCLY